MKYSVPVEDKKVNSKEKVNIVIDNMAVSVEKGVNILEAAKKCGIKIPTLCYHPDQFVKANCRICVVEVEGETKLLSACSTEVREGMVIRTNSARVLEARKVIIELLLANHDADCLTCHRNLNCELQDIANQSGVRINRFENILERKDIDRSSPALVRDINKCVKCGRCIEICREVQGLNILENIGRSYEVKVLPTYGKYLNDTECTACGQCATVCPVAAIYEKEDIDKVWDALNNPDMHVVVQTAPAVRVVLGEEFGMEPGAIVTGKMVAALRRLGFDKVFDTNFTADLTIIEEGYELLERIKEGSGLPLFSSCSPGWINFIERQYPEFLENVSTCKSPQQMFGALAKTYYAEKENIYRDNLFTVSIMPCTAKKYEAERPEMSVDGIHQDVDAVLTTRELGRMLKQAGIDFEKITEEEYDEPFGISTGAAVIFGASGGVAEAALRTVYEIVTGEELENVDFCDLRGMEGIKEATVKMKDISVNVAAVNTLSKAGELIELIKSGKKEYHFVEVMACPGGCIGGGGQPYHTTNKQREERIKAIYSADAKLPVRQSHKNPAVKKLYDEFLIKPLGEKSHDLLHTHYTDKKNK